MKRLMPILALVTLGALGGCAVDPYVEGPFHVGQAPTLNNALNNRYRPSDQRMIYETQARADTVSVLTEDRPVVVRHDTTPARQAAGRRVPAQSSGRSAW